MSEQDFLYRPTLTRREMVLILCAMDDRWSREQDENLAAELLKIYNHLYEESPAEFVNEIKK